MGMKGDEDSIESIDSRGAILSKSMMKEFDHEGRLRVYFLFSLSVMNID